MFSSADVSLMHKKHLLLLLDYLTVSYLHTFVTAHIKPVEKPVHIFIVTGSASKSCLMPKFNFRSFYEFRLVFDLYFWHSAGQCFSD